MVAGVVVGPAGPLGLVKAMGLTFIALQGFDAIATVAGEVKPSGGVATNARIPINSSGAVSPSARAMPIIVPVSMPGRARGRT